MALRTRLGHVGLASLGEGRATRLGHGAVQVVLHVLHGLVLIIRLLLDALGACAHSVRRVRGGVVVGGGEEKRLNSKRTLT
jgi:hypothetical protein